MRKRPKQAAGALLKIAGTAFIIIGGLGIVFPLLPTAPFLMLAAVCYAKSSERGYRCPLYNRWFGGYIRNWHEGRGIPMKTKILSIAFLILTMGYSAAFVVPSFIGKVVLLLIAICVSMHILSFPTLKPDAGA